MEAQNFVDHIDELTGLELAILLSLVAQHHCLIETPDEFLDDVTSELALIVRDIFKLSYIIINSHDLQSVDRFVSAILDDASEFCEDESNDGVENGTAVPSKIAGVSFRGPSSTQIEQLKLDSRRVVNVVIAKDFNLAHEDVQIQALELIRRRRIFSRTTVHPAPKVFLLLPVVATASKHIRLNKHLNDRIFISHYHGPDDGFPNLEDFEDSNTLEDHESTYSDSRSPSVRRQELTLNRHIDNKVGAKEQCLDLGGHEYTLTDLDVQLIEHFRAQGHATTITPEVRRYLQDIVAFLRMERGVDGGVTPYATTLFLALAKYLAPFHGTDYVTPSLVALAAKKVYPHRIVMATPSRERSTQYGTSLASARDLLRDLDPETVIQNVLETVECPT